MEEGQYGPAEDALKKTAGSWDGGLAALGKMALAGLYQQTGRDQIYAQLKDNDKDSKGKPGAAAQVATEKLNPDAAAGPAQ